MAQRTVLYAEHLNLNARMVDFAGWDMPLHYGSQLEEHHAVRQHAGIFDVSHMNVVDIEGETVTAYLRYVLANDVAKLQPGKALYTCMLNHNGGIIDDLIVYCFSTNAYRLVLNASTREKDLVWLQTQAQNFAVRIHPREDLAIIALQGPHTFNIAESVFGGNFIAACESLKPFYFQQEQDVVVARTGYTGEEGLEIILPTTKAVGLWHKLLGAGAKPIGLGARDTLRLEAGLNLYGLDMDESTTPLESHLAWTVAFQPEARDFIGRQALIQQQQRGVTQHLIGLILEKGGILRHGQTVFYQGQTIGHVTSGGFSPTLQYSIAFARVSIKDLTTCEVELRGKQHQVRVTKPLFVRKGKALV